MKNISSVQRMARAFSACVLVLVGLSSAGCFRSLDPRKLTCSKDSSCPSGYYCSSTGRCVEGKRDGSADGVSDATRSGDVATTRDVRSLDGALDKPLLTGGSVDTGTAVGGAGGTGSGGTDTTTGTGGTGGLPEDTSSTSAGGAAGSSPVDAPVAGSGGAGGAGGSSPNRDALGLDGVTTLPAGSSCQRDDECTLGFCTDGVCCNERCAGQCQACAENGSVGTCKTVTSGQPRGTRTDCAGTGMCQGACDGSSATACKMPTNRICQNESCSANGHIPASYCNSSGACALQSASPCPTGLCDGAICAGSCTSISCPNGQYCSSSGVCANKKASGTGNTCTAGGECVSGNCSPDGVCCESPCSGQCQTCNNTAGTCTRVTSGQPVAGRPACTNASDAVCGGRCNGTSDNCTYPTASTSCGDPPACTTPDYSSRIVSACNSAGSCTANTTNCSSSGQTCIGGSCTAKIATDSSTACQVNGQCASGACCSNRCRDLNNDSSNCGICGRVCGNGTICNGAGTCACPSGQLNCGTGCVDILSNNDHCSACNTPCKTAGYACTSGSCVCTGKLVTNCMCLAWNFNDGDTDNTHQGWSWGGGIRGTICDPGSYGVGTEVPESTIFVYPPPPTLDGTRALFVTLDGPSASNCGAGAGVNLCSTGAVLGGLTVSAKMLFKPASGTSPYTGSVGIATNSTASAPTNAPSSIPAGQWITVSATVPDEGGSLDNQFSFIFYPGDSWKGWVWIDNITIK